MELSQTVTLEENFANLDVFKKSKQITFFAKCSYTLDFSKLTDDDINIDSATNTINISIDKPSNFNIMIDDSKTKYADPELGLFRFSDIKLSSEEYGNIYKKITDSFANKMKDDELYKQCLYNSENILENLLLNFTNKSYIVKMSFKTS